MNHFVSFRAPDDFLDALRSTAFERCVPVSRLIREALSREIQHRPEKPPYPPVVTPACGESGA
jgi:hypothetical protein